MTLRLLFLDQAKMVYNIIWYIFKKSKLEIHLNMNYNKNLKLLFKLTEQLLRKYKTWAFLSLSLWRVSWCCFLFLSTSPSTSESCNTFVSMPCTLVSFSFATSFNLLSKPCIFLLSSASLIVAFSCIEVLITEVIEWLDRFYTRNININ